MGWGVIFTVHFWLTRGTVYSENQRSWRENISTALYFSWFKHKSSSGWTPQRKVYLVEERVSSALLKDEGIHIRIAGVANHLHWSCLLCSMLADDLALCIFIPHSLPSLSQLRDCFRGHIWAGQMLEVDWKKRRKGSWRLASTAATTTWVHITRTRGRAARWPGDSTGYLCVPLLSPSLHPIHILCTVGVPRRH